MIKTFLFTLPLWIGQQGADDEKRNRDHTAEQIPEADLSRLF